MKITNVAAIVAVAALAAVGSAQRPPMGGPGGMGGGMRGPMDPKQQADMMTQRMTETAGLNPAQQAKVKAIMLKSAIEMRKITDARMAALKKVLTPDQMAKVATMRGMGRGPGGPGGPGGMRGGPGGAMGRGPGRP